jgi:hypothetical protein
MATTQDLTRRIESDDWLEFGMIFHVQAYQHKYHQSVRDIAKIQGYTAFTPFRVYSMDLVCNFFDDESNHPLLRPKRLLAEHDTIPY